LKFISKCYNIFFHGLQNIITFNFKKLNQVQTGTTHKAS